MEKYSILEKEINLIQDMAIKEWTKATLNNAPDYFYKAWASSTGKYHPQCTCKEGGLIIHVKRAVYIANRLCTGWGIENIDRDIVLTAVILHDIAKTGVNTGTKEDYINHPINAEKYFTGEVCIDKLQIDIINECIRHHMGLWTPEKIRKPLESYIPHELIVYMADYMAATKDLITPVDNE